MHIHTIFTYTLDTPKHNIYIDTHQHIWIPCMLHPIPHMHIYPHSIYTHSLPSINHTHPKHTYTYFNAHMYHQTQSHTTHTHTKLKCTPVVTPIHSLPQQSICMHSWIHTFIMHTCAYIHIYNPQLHKPHIHMINLQYEDEGKYYPIKNNSEKIYEQT